MSRKRAGQRIKELRDRGYTIKVKQLRQGTVGFAAFGEFRIDEIRDRREKDSRFEVHPRGGRTEVTLTTPDGTTVVGEARCRVDDWTKGGKWREGDMFNKNIGLTIALNRALHELGKQDNEALVRAMSNNGGWSLKEKV